MIYNQRDIVLVPFPYSDLTGIKKRPVLVISNDSYNKRFEDILVCVITSQDYNDEFSIKIEDIDLEYGFMPEISCVKCHKIFSIHKSKVIKKYSSLSSEKYKSIYNVLINLFSKK